MRRMQAIRPRTAPMNISCPISTPTLKLNNASGMFYALSYVVLFAIPIVGLRRMRQRPPLWLRVASFSGLGMTVLYVTLSIFPIIKVDSVVVFALKIVLLIAAMNLLGIGILLSARRRASAAASV